MLLGSRIGTSAYDLLPLLQRGQDDDAALAAEAAGSLSLGAVTCAGLARNQATDAVLPAGHCQLLLACEPLACRAVQPSPHTAKSSINEAYYNLDKVFA